MRSSKHQTRASTDTRSLATAFIGGSVCALVPCLPAFAFTFALKRKRGAVGVRAARAGPASVAGRTSV
jgi:hypothetical protein